MSQTAQQAAEQLHIPKHQELFNHNFHNLSSLEQFIFSHHPSTDDDTQTFRYSLSCAIKEVYIAGWEASRRNQFLSGGNVLIGYQDWIAQQLQWIPVTERLPERMQNVLFVVDCRFDHDNGRILGGWYTGEDFVTPGVTWKASRWCPIPDSLLNFKP
jgi:hypothetical protein